MKTVFNLGERVAEIDHGFFMPGQHKDLMHIMSDRALITDVSGVPLDSDRHDPPTDLDFEYTECPYRESPTRYPDGEPSETPMSGLEVRRLNQSFPRIRRHLLATRAAYFKEFDLPEDYEMTIEDGFNVLTTMQYLSTYLTDRVEKPVPRMDTLPQHIIVGANCASGSIGALGAYALGENQLLMPSGAVMLDAAEHEEDGGLVGPNTVCAAPPRMIVQFLDLLKDGSDAIPHGTLKDETDGLTNDRQLPAALVVGSSMESALGYNRIALVADFNCIQALKRFNPRKHNPRKAKAALGEFKEQVGIFLAGYQEISARVNMGLQREPFRTGEFEGIYEDDPFDFGTIALAKAKGLNIL